MLNYDPARDCLKRLAICHCEGGTTEAIYSFAIDCLPAGQAGFTSFAMTFPLNQPFETASALNAERSLQLRSITARTNTREFL